MSLLYTTIRLWWDGRHGQAQYGGIERHLSTGPKINGAKVAEIDYCPEFHTYEIRRRDCDKRGTSMEPPELESAHAWLMRFVDVMGRRIERVCRRAL